MRNTFWRNTGAVIAVLGCAVALRAADTTKVTQADFGKMPDGAIIHIYTLSDPGTHLQARVMDYAGVIVSLRAPDRTGAMADVVNGFDTLPEYLANPTQYFGACIGRYGNRIANGRFSLDGVEYNLPGITAKTRCMAATTAFSSASSSPAPCRMGGSS